MLLGVRVFISVLFIIIGLSFLATTGVLIYEFQEASWLTLATFYSHLFLFFPTFGLVTLAAFYTPACVFLDMYWRHVKFGRVRFIMGFIAVALLSYAISLLFLASPERSVWEAPPSVLAADRGEPGGCADRGNCVRLPVLTAVENVRAVSQQRLGLSDLARNCSPDQLVRPLPGQAEQRRFCFASTPLKSPYSLATDEECCRSQRAFVGAINAMAYDEAERSLTGHVHTWLLPLKIFFMLMLLVISILLALRRRAVEKYYDGQLAGIERGVLVGAAAMVIYPIMSHAFLQSAALLYGAETAGGYRGIAPLVSLAFGAWGLLLLFFFYGRHDQEMQALARMGGIAGGAVAVAKYDNIIDFFVRVLGSGASYATIAVIIVAAIAALVVLYVRTSGDMEQTTGADSAAGST